jgi:hypothetical protein
MENGNRQAARQRRAPKLRPLPGALPQSLGQCREHPRPDGGIGIRLIPQGIDVLLPGLRQLPQVHAALARTKQRGTRQRREIRRRCSTALCRAG